MFNADEITEKTIHRITEHYKLLHSQIDIPELRRAIALLVDRANQDTVCVSDQEVAEVIAATQHVLDLLFCTPFSQRRLPIPGTFWDEPQSVGAVLYQTQLWLQRTLVNYTEAAAILNSGFPEKQAAAVAFIRRKVEQGTLIGFIDPFEPNPQHAKRVRQSAVELYYRQRAVQQDAVA